MNCRRTTTGLFTFLAVILGSTAQELRFQETDFDREIAPILSSHCLDCHSQPKPKGGLDLAAKKSAMTGGKSGQVIVPGKPDQSLLWEYVEGDKMPPKKPLSEPEKSLLKKWIAAGAKWGSDPIDSFRFTSDQRAGYDWWSLQPLKKPALPAVKNSNWFKNPIDRFILHRLEAKGLSPSPPAAKRALIRRLSFDLLGLPPQPKDVQAFLQDNSSDAYEKLCEQYLRSPQLGVRWARHWLDVARFGESNGFEYDEFRNNSWPYRDWVVNAFNQDMPYNEFARRQLAGDVMWPGDPEAIKATGFLTAGAYDTAGQSQQSVAMKMVVRQDELEDIVGTVGQTFLGLTVNCARCHDHKFDPVKQVEYYRLTAALGGVRHGERDLDAIDEAIVGKKNRLTELAKQIEAMDAPVRSAILAARKVQNPAAPQPIAGWEFRKDGRERITGKEAAINGGARLIPHGLKVDGSNGYSVAASIPHNLKAKTIEAWVTLDNLRQRGGATISIQTPGGGAFDAIVFGELEPGKWMAGSNGFTRTQSFNGPEEVEADKRPVHFAVVYGEDGMVTGYRNGRLYGRPYQSSGPQTFKAGQYEVVFGLRHSPPGGNRMLAGVIHRAQLHDRVLSPAEVAASAGSFNEFVLEAELLARMSPAQLAQRKSFQEEVGGIDGELSRLARKVYAVVPKQPEPAHLLVRGNPGQPGEIVAAGGVAALAGVSADFGSGADSPDAHRRKRLAQWLTDSENPLFARVIVNRLWHYHFGVGLVDTPNDLGFNGGRPSHPELLDWLAGELIENHWSLKHIHRLIVQSETYRQSSISNPAAMKVDAGNRLLWRKSPLRLEAEMVRDTILSVAGKLNPDLGGPSFKDFKLAMAPGTNTFLYSSVDDDTSNAYRRTLYRAWARSGKNEFLNVFDCPDPSTTAPSRGVTTTPLQALAMLNGSLILRMADRFAERVQHEAGPDIASQIALAYELAYGRPPTAQELKAARLVVDSHGLPTLARAIFNSNEFLYVD